MKISTNCFAVTGLYYAPPWTVNAGFITGDKKTLIIDSGSNYISAQTIYGYAQTVKPDNEIILINTEKHLDHIGGNSYFCEKGINIYGHFLINREQNELTESIKKMNSLITNKVRNYAEEACIAFEKTDIINPDHKISDDMEMDLGKCGIQIIMTPGHTKTNLSVYNKKEKVLFCGDAVLPKFIPGLEDGTDLDWNIWIQTLEKIKLMDIDFVVPGHGNVIIGKDNVLNEIERTKIILLNAIKNNTAPTKIKI